MYHECPFCFKHNGSDKPDDVYSYNFEKKCYEGSGCDECYDCGIMEIPDNFYSLVDYFLGD